MPTIKSSPAQAWVNKNAWLTKSEDTPVVKLKATSSNTADIVVRDFWSKDDPDNAAEMNNTVADHGASLIEDVVDGVKLTVRTEKGYVGQNGNFPTGDEQYFATSIPGVTSQVGEVGYDINKDGAVGDDETAVLFEVESAKRAKQINKLVVDKYGDYPVVFEVDRNA